MNRFKKSISFSFSKYFFLNWSTVKLCCKFNLLKKKFHQIQYLIILKSCSRDLKKFSVLHRCWKSDAKGTKKHCERSLRAIFQSAIMVPYAVSCFHYTPTTKKPNEKLFETSSIGKCSFQFSKTCIIVWVTKWYLQWTHENFRKQRILSDKCIAYRIKIPWFVSHIHSDRNHCSFHQKKIAIHAIKSNFQLIEVIILLHANIYSIVAIECHRGDATFWIRLHEKRKLHKKIHELFMFCTEKRK